MTQLHVRKVVLILNEELAAVLAHVDSHVGYDVFEVAFRELRVEMRVVLDVDLFEAHRLQDSLVNFDWFVLFTRQCVKLF